MEGKNAGEEEEKEKEEKEEEEKSVFPLLLNLQPTKCTTGTNLLG